MNYRHAFHAGNFADVMKHAVLARVITLFRRKDAAFRVIDTHAGVGLYDLSAAEPGKTGEWHDGIGRVLAAPFAPEVAALLAPYLAAVAGAGGGDPPIYPGSPMVARQLLRRVDRLTLTELHPDDAVRLAASFAGDIQVRVVELDGWLALKSFVPPKERRGIVLVDPPFEVPGEFDRLVDGLMEACRRFATGCYMMWYPIKDEREVAGFHDDLVATGIRRMLRVELRTAAVAAGRPLSACGLIIVNPPWTLDAELAVLMPALAARLATGRGAAANVDWLVSE